MLIDKVLIIASAIIKNKQGKILLLQRSKKSSYSAYWQLVEGKLEKGESPNEALKREIKEETSLSVLKMDLSSVFYNEIKAKGLKYLCFRIVFNITVDPKVIKTSDEHVSFDWFDKEEILKLRLLPGTEKIMNELF
ncbi:MAG: NUDIX hydrolase [bacterium]|nr:NUDIX hydrolase [bacterium]